MVGVLSERGGPLLARDFDFDLPERCARELAGPGQERVRSSKLSGGDLERDRYYVGLDAEGRAACTRAVARLLDALAAPRCARNVLELELGAREIGAIGCAVESGRTSYRLYLARRSASGSRSAPYGLGLAWSAGTPRCALKQYWGPDRVDAREAGERLRAALARARDGAAAEQVARACEAIVLRAPAGAQSLRVVEPERTRFSVDLGFARGERRVVADFAAELRAIASALAIAERELEPWLDEIGAEVLANLAAGVDRSGRPFVTCYFAPAEPSQAAGADAPRASEEEPAGARAVYAFGRIGLDPGTDLRARSLARAASGARARGALASLLAEQEGAQGLVWTLRSADSDVYALRADGPWVPERLDAMRRAAIADAEGRAALVAVAGALNGFERLASGRELPRLVVAPGGWRAWDADALARTFGSRDLDADLPLRLLGLVQNAGASARARALNFAVASLLDDPRMLATVRELDLQLHDAAAAPARFAPRDRWDVELRFFDPQRRREQSLRVLRLSIDVREPVPVLVGRPRSWSAR